MSKRLKIIVAASVGIAVIAIAAVVIWSVVAQSKSSGDPSIELQTPDVIETVTPDDTDNESDKDLTQDVEESTIDSNIEKIQSIVMKLTSSQNYDAESFDQIVAELSELGVTVENVDEMKAPFIAYTDDVVFAAVNMSGDFVKVDSNYVYDGVVKRAVSPTYGLTRGAVSSNIRSNLEATRDQTYNNSIKYTLSVLEDRKTASLKLDTPSWWE